MRTIAVFMLAGLMSTGPALQQGPPPPDAPAPPRVTDPARPDVGYMPWAGSDATVVVVFSVQCSDCAASVPFYRRLQQRIGENTARRSMVFLTQDGIWPAIGAIEKHPEGFKPGRVVAYPRDDRFALKGMPTVLLFGDGWKRTGEWHGRLDAAGEREVLAAIDALIGGAKERNGHE